MLERWQFKAEVMPTSAFRPVFLLSTGRAGTAFLTRLLNRSPAVHAWHEPNPQLIEEGRVAYELYTLDRQGNGSGRKALDRALGQVVLAGREQLWHETHVRGRRYIETNNRISFFAPAIRALLPGVRFVHVHRHPGEFVRSGLRRQWYTGRTPHDQGRIRPVGTDPAREEWERLEPVDRIAWLWNETNAFIEWALTDLRAGEDYLTLNFSEATADTLGRLAGFVGATLPEREFIRALAVPVNAERAAGVPEYQAWPAPWRAAVHRWCGERAGRYGYRL